MTLRTITIDNSVRYISKDDHFHREQAPHTLKERKENASNKKLSQKRKKFNKNITGEGYGTLKWRMNCYF